MAIISLGESVLRIGAAMHGVEQVPYEGIRMRMNLAVSRYDAVYDIEHEVPEFLSDRNEVLVGINYLDPPNRHIQFTSKLDTEYWRQVNYLSDIFEGMGMRLETGNTSMLYRVAVSQGITTLFGGKPTSLFTIEAEDILGLDKNSPKVELPAGFTQFAHFLAEPAAPRGPRHPYGKLVAGQKVFIDTDQPDKVIMGANLAAVDGLEYSPFIKGLAKVDFAGQLTGLMEEQWPGLTHADVPVIDSGATLASIISSWGARSEEWKAVLGEQFDVVFRLGLGQ